MTDAQQRAAAKKFANFWKGKGYVYALAHCVKVRTQEIFDIYKNNPIREVGAFSEFYTLRQNVEHAYDKLVGIQGKLPFDDVYSYLSKFLSPLQSRTRYLGFGIVMPLFGIPLAE